jgi:hypothetical protein
MTIMMASIIYLLIPFSSYPGEDRNEDSRLSIKFNNNSQIKAGIRWLNVMSWSMLARMRKRGNL